MYSCCGNSVAKVAKLISERCASLNKPVLALGGAKNHLVACGDCNVELASKDIVTSFCGIVLWSWIGCSGQRCMAASVLIIVGENKPLIKAVVEKAASMTAGIGANQIGPVIDQVLGVGVIYRYPSIELLAILKLP